jgi:hypothetical protein
MAPVPSICQPLADQVAALRQQYESAAAQAAAASGAPAWADLAEAGSLLEQLTQTEADLDLCVRTHSAALTGTVTVIDATGGQSIGAQAATLWDLTGSGPVATEVVPVQAGAFGFQGPVPTEAAITLQSTGAQAPATGLDFRSGSLAPAEQTPRVELVVAPTAKISAAALDRWASAFVAVTQPLTPPAGAPLGPLQATVNAVGIALGAGSVSITASGSISGTVLGTAFPQIPVSAGVSLSIAPSVSPRADDLVLVALAGSNPVSLHTSSPILAAVADIVDGLLADFVGDLVRNQLDEGLHQLLPSAIARSLALAELPPSTTSLRTLTVDETGISYQPTLGAIGTTLSTFTPTPLATP